MSMNWEKRVLEENDDIFKEVNMLYIRINDV